MNQRNRQPCDPSPPNLSGAQLCSSLRNPPNDKNKKDFPSYSPKNQVFPAKITIPTPKCAPPLLLVEDPCANQISPPQSPHFTPSQRPVSCAPKPAQICLNLPFSASSQFPAKRTHLPFLTPTRSSLSLCFFASLRPERIAHHGAPLFTIAHHGAPWRTTFHSRKNQTHLPFRQQHNPS